MKINPINFTKPPITTSPPKSPMEAMHEMKGLEDISRHERAEESIRQYFRDLLKSTFSKFNVDKRV